MLRATPASTTTSRPPISSVASARTRSARSCWRTRWDTRSPRQCARGSMRGLTTPVVMAILPTTRSGRSISCFRSPTSALVSSIWWDGRTSLPCQAGYRSRLQDGWVWRCRATTSHGRNRRMRCTTPARGLSGPVRAARRNRLAQKSTRRSRSPSTRYTNTTLGYSHLFPGEFIRQSGPVSHVNFAYVIWQITM